MQAFVVTVPAEEVELASDVLWQLGVRAIEERQPGGGDVALADTVELWTSVGSDPDAVVRAETALAGRWTSRTEVLSDTADAAATTWRDHALPIEIDGDVVVVPDWLDVDEHMRRHRWVIRIEPAGAFGLGDHPTTRLSLHATKRLVTSSCDVFDVGCGTGVVAIAAALLQDRPVRAVDIASAAVEATLDNAARNGVAARLVVDSTPAGEVEGDFDLVVANILAPTLIELSADLRRLTRAGGRLVISGILADRHQHVLRALEPMEVEHTEVLDGWAAVTLRHPVPPRRLR